MKKILITILSAVFLLSGAAAFTACDGRKVTLAVWCAEMDKPMIEKMVGKFIETKPAGVKGIDVKVVEDDKARDTLRSFNEDLSGELSESDFAALLDSRPDAAADVVCMPHDQLGALVSKNYLSKIDVQKHGADINKNTQPSIKAGQIGGNQYGFPSSFETHMLFYDKSIVSDEAAKTLEGILACAVSDGHAFGMDFDNAYFSANWFFTYGCKLFGDNGEEKTFCDFNSAGGIDAMTYLIENRDDFTSCGGDGAIELFKAKKLGAFIGGPWDAEKVRNALVGNYRCAKLPSVEGKDMKSFAGFKLYCVNSKSKNQTAAMNLAAYLTNKDNQKERLKQRNLNPVATELENDPDLLESTTAKALMAQGPNAIAMPSIPEMSNFWVPTKNFTFKCYNGEIQISELLNELTALKTEILKSAA